MFRLSSSKPLRLILDDGTFAFPDVAGFEFALAGRTALPGKRVAAMLAQSKGELLRDAENIRRVALRITQIVTGGPSEPANLTGFLMGLDRSLISQDHNWRSILGAMAQYDSSTDDYKRAALVKYGQYLAAREDAARAVFAAQGDAPGEQSVGANGVSATLIVDLSNDANGANGANGSFDRLPKGETIEIPLASDETLPLMLVKHHCEILGGPSPEFVDAAGNRSTLRAGKTIIGRDTRSDITVTTGRRDVSRKHLIIEATSANVVRLTDISSLGTFVPPRYLDKTGS